MTPDEKDTIREVINRRRRDLEAMAEEAVAKSQAGYVGGEAARVARIADQRMANNPTRHTLGEALAEAIKSKEETQ